MIRIKPWIEKSLTIRKVLIIMALPLIFSGCAKPWMSEKNLTRIILPNVHGVKGEHCESSAMLNAMLYLGYPVDEPMIVGGGAALGFEYQKSNFPFLGGRSLDMREVFAEGSGIKWHTARPDSAEESWKGVVELLKKDIPVVLRVDMRYLPYRYGGKYGAAYMSFGGHYITLFGIDFEKEIAYVSDREYDQLQTIRLTDLEKARSSKTKVFPPGREYCWVEPKPQDYKLNWEKMTRNAVHKLVQNLENPASNSNSGLKRLKLFPDDIRYIETYAQNRWLLPVIFTSLRGYIEEFGTGGAAFRMLVRDFFSDASHNLKNKEFKETIAAFDESIAAWHNLAGEFKSISTKIKDAKTKSAREALYQNAAGKAEILYEKEVKLVAALKKIDETGD